VKAIEQRDADHGGSDTGVMSQCRKGQGFHLHVDDSILMNLMKEFKFLLLRVVAEGSIQTTLPYKKKEF